MNLMLIKNALVNTQNTPKMQCENTEVKYAERKHFQYI